MKSSHIKWRLAQIISLLFHLSISAHVFFLHEQPGSVEVLKCLLALATASFCFLSSVLLHMHTQSRMMPVEICETIVRQILICEALELILAPLPSWLRGSDWRKHWTSRTVVTVVVWAVVACKFFSGAHLATVEAENGPNEKKNLF